MIEAPLPLDEKKRMASLGRLNVLNTPMEDRYERITRMVCMMLNVPIAAFTLVDDTRQWFKSIQGLPVNSTSRSVAFCAHAILTDDLMVVNDAKKDKRFADNPLVTGSPDIAFYAGYPVHAPDGQRIGSLCAIDTKPRELTAKHKKILNDLGKMVEAELKKTQSSKIQSGLLGELKSPERVSMLDELSRLWNREGILEVMRREWIEGEKNRTEVAIVQASIDGFSALNSSHGKDVGDAVLQEAAKRLTSALGPDDALGRLGNDNFLIVLPNCEPERLNEVLEKMRSAANAAPVTAAGKNLTIRMTFGAAMAVPAPNIPVHKVIDVSAKALQEARIDGGDRYLTMPVSV